MNLYLSPHVGRTLLSAALVVDVEVGGVGVEVKVEVEEKLKLVSKSPLPGAPFLARSLREKWGFASCHVRRV
jgi:hypothetical protein